MENSEDPKSFREARRGFAAEPPAFDLAWLQAEIDKGRASDLDKRPIAEIFEEIMANNRSTRG